MQDNFERCYEWLKVHEGGKVDHPKDPGGRTNMGVTQKTYDSFRKRIKKPVKDVWNISEDEVRTIYKENYWTPAGCEHLPSGLDYAVFDEAVNSGVSRAVKRLQNSLRVTADGVCGLETLSAAISAEKEKRVPDVIHDMCYDRLAWMRTLSAWKTFGNGWTRRVMGEDTGAQEHDIGVIDRATALADGFNPPPPTKPVEGKAEGTVKPTSAAKEVLTSKEGMQAATGLAAALIGLGETSGFLQIVFGVLLLGGAGLFAWHWHKRRSGDD